MIQKLNPSHASCVFFQLEVLQRYCKKVAPLVINGAILLKISPEANALGNCATGNSKLSGTCLAP
jgi:hypothetical protein